MAVPKRYVEKRADPYSMHIRSLDRPWVMAELSVQLASQSRTPSLIKSGRSVEWLQASYQTKPWSAFGGEGVQGSLVGDPDQFS